MTAQAHLPYKIDQREGAKPVKSWTVCQLANVTAPPFLLRLIMPFIELCELSAKIDSGDLKLWRVRSLVESFDSAAVPSELSDNDLEQMKSFYWGWMVLLIRPEGAPQEYATYFCRYWERPASLTKAKCTERPGAVKFLEYVEDVVSACPSEKGETIAKCKEYLDAMESLDFKRATDLRMLDCLDEEPEDVQCEVVAKFIGLLGQNYEEYVRLVFELARTGTQHGLPTRFGLLTTQGRALLAARYPSRLSLIDPDIVHYRNAFRGHDSYRVEGSVVSVWDGNSWGPKTLSLQDLASTLDKVSSSLQDARVALEYFLVRQMYGPISGFHPEIKKFISVVRDAILKVEDHGDRQMWDGVKQKLQEALQRPRA